MHFLYILFVLFLGVDAHAFGRGKDLDIRTDLLRRAYKDPGSTAALTVITRILLELNDRKFNRTYDDLNSELDALDSGERKTDKWKQLRTAMSALTKRKVTDDEIDKVLRFIWNEWGYEYWEDGGFKKTVWLEYDNTMRKSLGGFVFPNKHGVIGTAAECAALFSAMLVRYRRSPQIMKNIALVMGALEYQRDDQKKEEARKKAQNAVEKLKGNNLPMRARARVRA